MTGNQNPTALVELGANVAKNVTLGCFVQVCTGASVGNDSIIEGLTIVPSGVSIHDRVRVGRGAAFTSAPTEGLMTVIADDVTIGPHAIIQAGVSIGKQAVIAPGSFVQRSIPSMAIVEGTPAKIVGYVGAMQSTSAPGSTGIDAMQLSHVRGVHLFQMPCVSDVRGNLTVGEFGRNVPFEVKRYFMVFDVPTKETRGEHAHKECHQFLICVRGSCAVVADDGTARQEFLLDRLGIGVHLPPMVWGIQYKFSTDAVLLVFASHHYDSADYIRDYAEFRNLVGVTA